MRRSWLVLGVGALLAAVAVVLAVPRETAPSADAPAPAQTSPAPDGALVEEFDGPALDPRLWGTCHWWSAPGCTIETNDELEWYLPEQVSVADGVLRLTAEAREVASPQGQTYPYVSGMVSSGPPFESKTARFAFRYGRAEIRARVPSGRGLWSAFWLLPADRESTPEIDVVEVLGDSPEKARMHFHWRTADGSPQTDGVDWVGPDFSAGWHTYAIDWRPGVLVWLIDGVERWRVDGPTVPDEPMYLVVNLAVGGDWAGAPDEGTAFPATLEVDRVEVSPR